MSRFVPNYYYEEGEGYVGDYSESDALSDGPPVMPPQPHHPDMSEFYRGKLVHPIYDQGGYCKGFYPSPEYYYEGGQTFLPPPPPPPPCCRIVRNHSTDEARRYYMHMPRPPQRFPSHYPPRTAPPPPPHPPVAEDCEGEALVYSQPQISGCAQRRKSPSSNVEVGGLSTTPVRKRPAVAVRTPRYYRRPGISSVYKKPSPTLCHPPQCKPDAFNKRNSKKLITQGCPVVSEESPKSRENPLERRDSLPDIKNPKVKNTKCNTESIPTNLDTVLTRCEKLFSEEWKPDKNMKMHVLKSPKVPSILKTKVKERTKSECEKVDRLEVEEITSEIVDSMLNELLNARTGGNPEQTAESNITSNQPENSPKSFNYEENSEPIQKSNTNIENVPNEVSSSEQIQCNDVIGDLKLYRSKSYIVDFIDRAVSKEMGTVPDEKLECAEPRKSLPLEATQILSDSHSMYKSPSSDQLKEPAGTSSKEEPLYIKQLKQLRWRHFRHIVREIKRLEDLERFLDHYNSEGTNQ